MQVLQPKVGKIQIKISQFIINKFTVNNIVKILIDMKNFKKVHSYIKVSLEIIFAKLKSKAIDWYMYFPAFLLINGPLTSVRFSLI